jgi:uncharacterized protein (DUF1499 family)
MTEITQASQGGWIARNYRKIAMIAFAVAVIGALIEFGSGLGYRFGLVPLGVALQRMLPWGAYLAAAGAALCLIALILGAVTYKGGFLRQGKLAVLGLIVGLAGVYIPYSIRYSDSPRPPIHDISTDLENPPAFVDILPLRAQTGATNTAEYLQENKRPGGVVINVPDAQRKAYPDVQPIMMEGVSPADAFNRALEAAKRRGWTVVTAKPEEGRIEAWDKTFWFGFIDDVVIRVTPTDNGSRVDVRSVSRVGGGDVGKNAERIRGYTQVLRSMDG